MKMRKVKQMPTIRMVKHAMKKFVIFFKLNSRFVEYEEGETAEEAIQKVANKFGIHPKFLEAMEKAS